MNTRSHNLELVSGGVEIEGEIKLSGVNQLSLPQTVTPRQVEEVSKGKDHDVMQPSSLHS